MRKRCLTSFIYWFTHQMTTARAGPGHNQEMGTPFESCLWVVEAQVPVGHLPLISKVYLQGSKSEVKQPWFEPAPIWRRCHRLFNPLNHSASLPGFLLNPFSVITGSQEVNPQVLGAFSLSCHSTFLPSLHLCFSFCLSNKLFLVHEPSRIRPGALYRLLAMVGQLLS